MICVIGASWGGLQAVGDVLAELPEGFPAPVVAVQHRAAESRELLVELLSARTRLEVREARDKVPLEPGTVQVAPAGYHTLVEPGHLALSTDAPVHASRPSLDVALGSAAVAYGCKAVGVVLTGANSDGAAGLASIRGHGGIALVQEPDSAERPEMPRAALAACEPHHVGTPAKLGRILKGLL